MVTMISTRNSFNRYYMTLVEIEDFDAVIDNKPFFDQPVKYKQEAFEKHAKMSKYDDKARHLLDY